MSIKFFLPIFIICTTLVSSCKNNKSNDDSSLDFMLNDTLSRIEMLKSIPIQSQNKLARSFNSEIQSKLWITKIEDTLACEDLSEEEKNEIRSLLPYLATTYFTDKKDILTAKCEELHSKLVENYGWDEDKVFIYLSNFYTIEEYRNILNR